MIFREKSIPTKLTNNNCIVNFINFFYRQNQHIFNTTLTPKPFTFTPPKLQHETNPCLIMGFPDLRYPQRTADYRHRHRCVKQNAARVCEYQNRYRHQREYGYQREVCH